MARDLGSAAALAVGALQQWYGADAYSRAAGLYRYDDPSLQVQWRNWSTAQISRNLVNAAIALSGRRDHIQDLARWWINANAITALVNYMSVTGDRQYLEPVIENTFKRAPRTHRPISNQMFPVKLSALFGRPSYSGFINGFYDDEGWWALAWIQAYDLTGDDKYLAAADDIFQDMTGGWDDVWGGGIYWGKHDGQPDRAGVTAVPRGWKGPYKNAIANELFIAVAASLALRYQRRNPSGSDHSDCLQWALRGWKWFSTPRPGGVAMINEASLVNDSPNSQGVNDNTQSIWSYNQGVILGGLSDLTALTGDETYAGWAGKIADAFIGNPWYIVPSSGKRTVPPPHASGIISGILHEHNECNADGSGWFPGRAAPGVDSTVFKGIFVRNLARLYLHTRRPGYREFILANAESALSNVNEHHQFGCNWAAPVDMADFVRQTAGVDLVNAALLVG